MQQRQWTVDVVWGQQIKLIQVVPTSEFNEYWWNDIDWKWKYVHATKTCSYDPWDSGQKDQCIKKFLISKVGSPHRALVRILNMGGHSGLII